MLKGAFANIVRKVIFCKKNIKIRKFASEKLSKILCLISKISGSLLGGFVTLFIHNLIKITSLILIWTLIFIIQSVWYDTKLGIRVGL